MDMSKEWQDAKALLAKQDRKNRAEAWMFGIFAIATPFVTSYCVDKYPHVWAGNRMLLPMVACVTFSLYSCGRFMRACIGLKNAPMGPYDYLDMRERRERGY